MPIWPFYFALHPTGSKQYNSASALITALVVLQETTEMQFSVHKNGIKTEVAASTIQQTDVYHIQMQCCSTCSQGTF